MLRAATPSSVDPLVQIDKKGIIKMVNHACCRVFQYGESDIRFDVVREVHSRHMIPPEGRPNQSDLSYGEKGKRPYMKMLLKL